MCEKKNYKDTLNLPNTDFSMKANLAQREPEQIIEWDRIDIYGKIKKTRSAKEPYVLHDGPPYANGNTHMGHALNKILKDVVVKSRSMQGFWAPYIPGWDCHGLPIELKVEEALGGKKAELSPVEFRKLCREHAAKFVGIQKDEFKRLGVFGEWDNPYITMSTDYESEIIRALKAFYLKGSVYKGFKPVHWCVSCETALAEAEVEYADHKSPSVYVKFPLVRFFKKELVDKCASVIIWTTTPWTLPANLAVAFHPELDYIAVNTEKGVFIIAEGMLNGVKEAIGFETAEIIDRFRGKQMEGGACRHPFNDRESVFVMADYVTLEAGTGCVHTAPGHGHDDYVTGMKYGLDVYAPVDEKGCFVNDVEHFAGMQVFKANKHICELMERNGSLMALKNIEHSYPHCWRCKSPVIFRATRQWFISMNEADLRTKALQGIQRTSWVPSWGDERITGMVKDRPDWCISRQRSWGVPITVLYCSECGESFANEEVFDKVIKSFSEEGSDSWYSKSVSEFLPEGAKCASCGSSSFRKEMDILDVWFESGTSHKAVLGKRKDLPWPCDLYLEGTDQYRGWFQSSLLVGTMTDGEPPFRMVLTHGFVVDEKGRKLSKSLGNFISPQKMMDKYGAEILRLWVAMTDYKVDVNISEEMLNRNSEAYRKIRNTCKFALGNIDDFNPEAEFDRGKLHNIDRWALSKLARFEDIVLDAYEKFEFHKIYHALNNFCSVDMSSLYFDIIKDRLYVSGKNSDDRTAAQWTLYRILGSLTRLMAPILPFTAEDVWKHIPGATQKHASIHMAEFIRFGLPMQPELDPYWEILFNVREDVSKALELARADKLIGNSLQAEVLISAPEKTQKVLQKYEKDLPAFFIVSKASLTDNLPDNFHTGTSPEKIRVAVLPAPGRKCERCWNYSETVGEDRNDPSICGRCSGVLNGMERCQ